MDAGGYVMRDIGPDEVEEFIRENHPAEEWRESDVLPDWVKWMMSHGCMDVFTEDGSSISVLMCSRMSTEDKKEENFDLNPDGDCLVIDLLLSTHRNRRQQLASLGLHLKNKHGVPGSVHWKRLRCDAPTTISCQQLIEKLHLPN